MDVPREACRLTTPRYGFCAFSKGPKSLNLRGDPYLLDLDEIARRSSEAWAAGAIYQLLQACLGLRVDAVERRVQLAHAVLPEDIEWLQMRNLSAGGAEVDLLLTRHGQDVGVTVMRRQGDIEILVTK